MATLSRSVVMDWQLSSYFGWGLIGIHFMTNWAIQQTELLLTTVPVREDTIDLNPAEWALIRPSIERSRELQAQLTPFRGQHVSINLPVLHGLGNDFNARGGGDMTVTGRPNLAFPFFEDSNLDGERRARISAYPVVVVGSTWNQALLEEAGVRPVELMLQGVDPTAFHPAAKGGWFSDRFVVFSGGKLEYRKGQDLVLKAFRAFGQRHRDALLVTAWASPWPGVARSFLADTSVPPVPLRADGRLDVQTWAAAHGIAPEQLLDLGPLPNSAMPRVYREMDVALFPNRCEGGTNLVAMECMACGLPVILSRNSGHLDLIAPDRCFPLEQQSVIDGAEHAGWGESDVEEIVAALETVYQDRSESRIRGAHAAEFMSTLTWAQSVKRLTDIMDRYI